VEKMCGDVGTEPLCHEWSNVPAHTPSEFYLRSISIPLVDHLLSEMHSRFSSHQQKALLGLTIVPSITVTLPTEECTRKISELVDLYRDDLVSSDCVTLQLHCW
jgi:hypothetical protein